MSADELDKETGSSDGLQPKKADLSCVHTLNELHLHEIHVVPSMHEADQYVNHINFFDVEYPEMLNDVKRVANDLNNGKSDSSNSSVSGSNLETTKSKIFSKLGESRDKRKKYRKRIPQPNYKGDKQLMEYLFL
uniref:Uncharacterized protein n=1 Tax=Tanacetum cinerariifolium TaxID=118510 RepID=A0A699HVR2_TANCI|nr:hypothetical protein [Tanacetum cinerariifolium]